MKNIYLIVLSAGLFLSSCGPTTMVQSDSYQPAPVADVSYQSFYDQLSPYGNWISYPGYGYVWMPNAGPDFQPYATNGNWIYTNAGWTWASNYSWGWAPFHYGRWFYEGGYGWIWVPGNEWAPAWVSWRGNGDYYGWAPMGPRISMDVALNNYNPPAYYWNLVPCRYFGNPNWHNYYSNGNQNVTIINNTTIINNYSGSDRTRYAYAPGPNPNEVRRYSGNHFKPVQLREANAPGERISGSQYVIYQPRVNGATRADAGGRPTTAAPTRYQAFHNVRPSTQYPSYNQPNNNQTAENNPRPPAQYTGNNQPANNPQPPVNNRPATQNPGNNQPIANPRPGGQNPGNNPPANNPQPPVNTRPVTQNPGNNQPVNNPQPPVNTRPVNQNPGNNQPANNPRSVGGNPLENPKSGHSNRPENAVNDPMNARQQNNSSADHNAGTDAPQTSRNAQPQTTGRPSGSTHNPNNGRPYSGTATHENKPKPAPQPVPPKPKDPNGN